MAYGGTKPFDVPGLTKALKVEDLKESRNIYNLLPDDSQQPEILESHIHNLAALFVRNRADGILGIHLAHSHFPLPENTALLGATFDKPYCRWARTAAIPTIDLSNAHGHIFVLTDHGFHPYECETGPLPDLSGIDNGFLPEFTDYLQTNNLSTLIGLQVIDQNPAHMVELVLRQATVMLNILDLNGCVSARRTGWKFEAENGEPRVCQSNESHGQHANGHTKINEGKQETFQDVMDVLVKKTILLQVC